LGEIVLENWLDRIYQIICGSQRDWIRTETVKAFMEILFDPCVRFAATGRAAVER